MRPRFQTTDSGADTPSFGVTRRASKRRRLVLTGAVTAAMAVVWPASIISPVSASSVHHHIDCSKGALTCTEVTDSEAVFGEGVYVGHDEPSVLFYSNRAGSGNQNQFQLNLPKDPAPSNPTRVGKSFNFELHPAFWFGMAMCDTQSYPEQVSTCKPDSNSNIADPALTPKHSGTAFMEMQFYPPGWVAWPSGDSCDATKWCAALNIDSLSENPVTGQLLNSTCASRVGTEYVNFAFMTTSGTPQPGSPPNPVNSTLATFTPNLSADLLMNSGDKLTVTEHDTAHGLQIVIHDWTTGQTGSMTTSAANGFGQVQFDPTGTSCNNIPYDFHPMYSTSSELTRVPWAAHSYNVAFSDEIGHFDLCTATSSPNGNCTGLEGIKNDQEPGDSSDTNCFDKTFSTNVQVGGCFNLAGAPGFDGVPYQPLWPDGNTTLRPTPIQFSSPLTGSGYNEQYSRAAFEVDLPRIEDPAVCDRFTGVGCTLIPTTDDTGPSGLPMPAAFYPFFSTTMVNGECMWQEGNHIPGSTNDFGQNAEYGTLENVTYTAVGGGPTTRYNDFRQILSDNPCRA
jgi:hypothetical protein